MINYYSEKAKHLEESINICLNESHGSYMEEQAAVEAGKIHLLMQIMKNTAVIADYITRIKNESEE